MPASGSRPARWAGEPLGAWSPAGNGRIIEQQLILTSHNLAALVERDGIRQALAGRAPALAMDCLAWALHHLQLPGGDWRVQLHRIKNAAYAWRQMVFFLSLHPPGVPAFLQDAGALLSRQPADFAQRMRPALEGLTLAARAPQLWLASDSPLPFLGWRDVGRWKRGDAARSV